MPNFQKINLRAIANTAVANYGFETRFPHTVMTQVNALDGQAPNKVGPSIKDLRNFLWSSIDNSDSLDLDQVEYCEHGSNGEILVKVGIADVDAYVPKGCAADTFAQNNTTSVYTGISTFPMLPNRLSQDLTSLKADEDRFAMVIEFAVQSNGEVKPGKIYRAIVRNKAKLVYEEVGAWLEGKGKIPKIVNSVEGLETQLHLQHEASLRLEKYRKEEGALKLQTLEARAVIQKEAVVDFSVVEPNPARYIIESFMIGANGVVSEFLKSARVPMIQRVVRTPKYWEEIVEVAKTHGTKLPLVPSAKALSAFLAEQKRTNRLRFTDLSLTIVKLLGPGEYVMYDQRKPIGHFCLAVDSYTHATAPNRRYVDLVIQRLLKAALKKSTSPYSKNELSQIAITCTERQKEAKKVQRFMIKVEAITLLMGKIGQTFNALVTGASDKGVYARLMSPPVEGRVVRGANGLKVGQSINVRLIGLVIEQAHINFERIS